MPSYTAQPSNLTSSTAVYLPVVVRSFSGVALRGFDCVAVCGWRKEYNMSAVWCADANFNNLPSNHRLFGVMEDQEVKL